MATRQSNTGTTDTLDNEQGGGFFANNGRIVGIVAIVLVVLCGGFVYYKYTKAQANEEATTALLRIRPYYDRGEYNVAVRGDSSKTINNQKIRGLTYIVDEWGSTPAGHVSALLLGSCYMALGQPAKAAGPFETAAGADDEIIASQALAGLASVAEASGKYEQAAKQYEEAAARDRLELNTPQFLLGAARNYERAGKADAAKENYRKVATQFPSAPANAQARLALARFNVEL